MDLNEVMNWLMPILVIGFFIGLIYVKAKEPLDNFFRWILNLIKSGGEKVKETPENLVSKYEIIYD